METRPFSVVRHFMALHKNLLAICLLAVPASGLADEGAFQLAGRRVIVWSPPYYKAPLPLIIYSHGRGGCATQARFLTEKLASHGYWVFAMDHQDNNCNRQEGPPEKPEEWNLATYADRKDDIMALLYTLKISQYARKIDFSRVGLLGYSLGGYTALGMIGGWKEWEIPGIRGVVAMSPVTLPYRENKGLSHLNAPVMYQGGTEDRGITPYIAVAGGAYDLSHAPKYFVEFEGANHHSWADTYGDPKTHELIALYALAFFDYYVKSGPPSPLLTTQSPGVSRLWHESSLGKSKAPRQPSAKAATSGNEKSTATTDSTKHVSALPPPASAGSLPNTTPPAPETRSKGSTWPPPPPLASSR